MSNKFQALFESRWVAAVATAPPEMQAFLEARRQCLKTQRDVVLEAAGYTFTFEYYARGKSVVCVTVSKEGETHKVRTHQALRFLEEQLQSTNQGL